MSDARLSPAGDDMRPCASADEIAALIERIVGDAKLSSARARDELRRELEDHFEDAMRDATAARGATAGRSVEAAREEVLARFGDVNDVAAGLRRAHRAGRVALYGLKIAGAAVVATSCAALLQLLVNLDVAAGALALTRWYVPAIRVSLIVVVLAVAMWELGIERLSVRLERAPATMIAVTVLLFAFIYLSHALSPTPVTATHAFLGAASLMAVWTSTLAILSRSDLVFLRSMGGEL